MTDQVERAREIIADTIHSGAGGKLSWPDACWIRNKVLAALEAEGLCIVEDTEWQKRKRALKDVGL
jgi:hypothetical protein